MVSAAALETGSPVNVARYLSLTAERDPGGTAILAPARRGRWTRVSYRELDARSDAIAHGLLAHGLTPGEPTLLMVRAGVPLITLTYACFKAGIVPILIDPGMGRRAFLRCVEESRPTAFVGIPLAHAARLAFPAAFRTVVRHVTFGPRLFWGGASLTALERGASAGRFPLRDTVAGDTAAILFTSGSTGPAKGVVYTHGVFEGQVRALAATYGFARGEIDLAAFPLFSLFDCAFGMTSLIPDLDPSRPGACDPERVVSAIREHGATSAFGSPAIWHRVAPWCLARGMTLPSLRRVLVAGAPVRPALIEQLHRIIAADGDVHTPYGASEALPVSTMAGREVVAETAALTRAGAGTCVGRPAGEIDVRLIRITDEPLSVWSDSLVVSDGEVGEICVRGPVVTRAYHNRPQADAAAKIADGPAVWHRMGDLGYRDAAGRLWFCGRKAERVETAGGPVYTDRVEGIANAHPLVTRSALIGVGKRGHERPVLVVEGPEQPGLAAQLLKKVPVDDVLYFPSLPVDVRHNAKIHRHVLKAWAEKRQEVLRD